MNSRVVRIVEVMAVGAAVALAAFLALGPVPTVEQWRAAGFFACFGVLAVSLVYRTSQQTLGSIGFLPSLSVALVSPNAAALLTVLFSSLVAEFVVRRAPLKGIFNAAQQVFSVAAGIGVYLALGGTSVLDGSGAPVVPFFALVLTYFTLNKLAVSTVVAAAEGGRTSVLWLRSMQRSALYDALAFPLILFFAIAYARLGPGWSAILALPMLGMRQLYRTVFALEKVNEELLQLMVASIEARDPYTSGHSQRVARYARVIARAAGFGGKLIDRTEVAALLHDVGKIHEEFAAILRKPSSLTEHEFEVMKTHPTRSADLIAKVSHFGDLVAPVRAHHEAWDGSGYPNQLRAEAIPLPARIIALADTVDAMTTSRPYRDGLSLAQVRDEIRRVSGKQFDPQICQKLLAPANWKLLTEEVASAQRAYPITSATVEESSRGNTGEFVSVVAEDLAAR